MEYLGARWQGNARIFFGLIGDDDQLAHAFAGDAIGDLQHAVAFGALTYALTTCHSDGIVVQNFVGDIDTRGNALANGQQAAVEVGAISEVGEDVLLVGKGGLAYPRHAFAAHLCEAAVVAVHPSDHVVTANAAHATRAFR